MLPGHPGLGRQAKEEEGTGKILVSESIGDDDWSGYLVTLVQCSVKPDPAHIDEVDKVYNKAWYSGYLDLTFDKIPTHMHYFYFPSQS